MLTLTIENKTIENIFLNEFHSNKDSFFEFIQMSYEKMKTSHTNEKSNTQLTNLQETSMSKTWNNDEDKAWDEL